MMQGLGLARVPQAVRERQHDFWGWVAPRCLKCGLPAIRATGRCLGRRPLQLGLVFEVRSPDTKVRDAG